MNEYKFCLYIAGKGPHSDRGVQRVKKILEKRTGGGCSLECVDVLSCLEEIAEKGVFVTPMLERVLPSPSKRVVGNVNTGKGVEAAVSLLMQGNCS